MAIMDELTEQEVSKNKAIRGYIIRAQAHAEGCRPSGEHD